MAAARDSAEPASSLEAEAAEVAPKSAAAACSEADEPPVEVGTEARGAARGGPVQGAPHPGVCPAPGPWAQGPGEAEGEGVEGSGAPGLVAPPRREASETSEASDGVLETCGSAAADAGGGPLASSPRREASEAVRAIPSAASPELPGRPPCSVERSRPAAASAWSEIPLPV